MAGGWWSSGSGRIEFFVPGEAVDDIARPGDASAAVEHWLHVLPELDADDLADELRGYGAWDDDALSDHDENRRRVLWIAACDVAEEAE